jgi:predicted membrane protein
MPDWGRRGTLTFVVLFEIKKFLLLDIIFIMKSLIKKIGFAVVCLVFCPYPLVLTIKNQQNKRQGSFANNGQHQVNYNSETEKDKLAVSTHKRTSYFGDRHLHTSLST